MELSIHQTLCATKGPLQDQSFCATKGPLQDQSFCATKGPLQDQSFCATKGPLQDQSFCATKGPLQDQSFCATKGPLQDQTLCATKGPLQDQTLCATKGPLQDQTLCATKGPLQDQTLSPSKKVMKIGGKDFTFLLDGDPLATQSGSGNVVRGRRGIGRGAGKLGLDKIGAENTQEGKLDFDWLGESGAELCSVPTANEGMSSRESDWPKESSTSQPEGSPLTTECADRNVSDKVLYILRGCPGSGKSTLARELKGERGCVFSTDNLFVGEDGTYAFDPKKVAAFHKRTQEMARAAVTTGCSPVVVDNTNTTAWEMRPYVEMALRRGYRVHFLEPDTPWRYDAIELSQRNSHGVGLDAIRRMLKRFQKNVSVESVMGREAMKRIRAGNFGDQLVDDETNSNLELLSNSADDCRSVGTSVSDGSVQDNENGAQEFESADLSTNQELVSADSQLETAVCPPNVDLVKTEDSKSTDFPTNQITASDDHILESDLPQSEQTADKTDVLFIDPERKTADKTDVLFIDPERKTADKTDVLFIDPERKTADKTDVLFIDPETNVDNQSEADHDSPGIEEELAPKKPIHKGAIVSNQERFNQQLISELSSRPNSVFCLNLQNIQVLEEIINIDKVLQVQSSFPLAQLLLPTHIRAQLTRTQVANFQHNYQRYIQHVLHGKKRDQSDLVSDTNQGVYSQAPMHATQPLVTLPLVPTANISQPHGHSLPSQPMSSQPSGHSLASQPISSQPSGHSLASQPMSSQPSGHSLASQPMSSQPSGHSLASQPMSSQPSGHSLASQPMSSQPSGHSLASQPISSQPSGHSLASQPMSSQPSGHSLASQPMSSQPSGHSLPSQPMSSQPSGHSLASQPISSQPSGHSLASQPMSSQPSEHSLPSQPMSSQPSGHSLASQPMSSQPSGHSLASQPISSQPSAVLIPVTSPSVNQQEMNSEMKPILPETNHKDKNLGDSKFPFQSTSTPITQEIKKSENQIKSIEPSFEFESEISFQNGAENSPNRDDVIDNSSLDTLSPDKSTSATSTLENNSNSLQATENPEGIQSGKEIHSSETIDHSMQTTSHCISEDSQFNPENLSNDQNKTNLNSSVDSTEEIVTTKEVYHKLYRHNSDSQQMALATGDNVFMENPPSVDESSSQSPVSEKGKGFSEKIDWSDSSGSEQSSPNLVTSGIQAPENPNSLNSELKQAPNSKPAAPWNTWSGWSSNFITPRTQEQLSPADQSDVAEGGRRKFDPIIQPPRKHPPKGTAGIPDFTPSFSRFRSFEDPSEIPLPHSNRLTPKSPSAFARPKWPTSDSSIKDNPHALLMPAGSEWQWGKATQSNTSKNETSEDDPRNSKPLNPFAIPWKPIDATTAEKLDHLKGFFPTLPLEELRAFLARNSNNVDRSVEAIIDQAEKHNLDLPMSSLVPLPAKLANRIRSPKKSDKVVTPLDASAPEFKTELSDTFETKWANDTSTDSWTNQSPFKESENFDTSKDVEPRTKEFQSDSTTNYVTDTLEDTFSATPPDPALTLNLSSEVVSFLVKNFGPIPGYTPASCLEKTQVIINQDSARQLHEIWCRGHAIQTQKFPEFFPPAPPPPQSGAPWVPSEDPTEQAKIRLYGMYPGIDTVTLDQILATKSFSLSAANNFIQAALNSAKVPQQNLVPSFAHVAKRASAQSFPPLPSKSQRQTNPLFSPNTANL